MNDVVVVFLQSPNPQPLPADANKILLFSLRQKTSAPPLGQEDYLKPGGEMGRSNFSSHPTIAWLDFYQEGVFLQPCQ